MCSFEKNKEKEKKHTTKLQKAEAEVTKFLRLSTPAHL